jgi:hypothetical protein
VVRDRFVATLGYRAFLFGDNATDFGMFYEGRKGKPYSWTFSNDANGDGVFGNDLMYIPTGPGGNDVVFRGGAAEEAAFWQVVRDNGLDRFAGQVVGRNENFSPWTNSFDIRISQQLPGFMDGHKTEIVLDLLNVGNLINKDWGGVGSYATGQMGTVAGVTIVKSNKVPQANDSANSAIPAGYRANYSTTVAIGWHPWAVGTVKLMDVRSESVWDPRRQSTLLLAKYACGHGILRPECAFEFKSA